MEVCGVTAAGEAVDVGFLHALGSLAPPPGELLAAAPPLQPAALARPPYPAAPPSDERPPHLILRLPMTVAVNRKDFRNLVITIMSAFTYYSLALNLFSETWPILMNNSLKM